MTETNNNKQQGEKKPKVVWLSEEQQNYLKDRKGRTGISGVATLLTALDRLMQEEGWRPNA